METDVNQFGGFRQLSYRTYTVGRIAPTVTGRVHAPKAFSRGPIAGPGYSRAEPISRPDEIGR